MIKLFNKKKAEDVSSSVVEVNMTKKESKESEAKMPEKSKEQLELEQKEKELQELRLKIEQEKSAADNVEQGNTNEPTTEQLIKEIHQMMIMVYNLETTKASLLERKNQ